MVLLHITEYDSWESTSKRDEKMKLKARKKLAPVHGVESICLKSESRHAN